MRVALVPFKGLSSPKARLSPILSLPQRQALAMAMLWDVLAALKDAKGLDGLALVSSDPKAMRFAEGFGFTAMSEDDSPGESASVDRATLQLMREGAESVLVIPGDVPLATPDEIDGVIALESFGPSVVMVPSWDGDGTNALLRRPPDLFPSSFGKGSFRRHMHEAESKGISVRVVAYPGLGLDIDTPEDLLMFIERHKRCHTYEALEELHLLPLLQRKSNS